MKVEELQVGDEVRIDAIPNRLLILSFIEYPDRTVVELVGKNKHGTIDIDGVRKVKPGKRPEWLDEILQTTPYKVIGS